MQWKFATLRGENDQLRSRIITRGSRRPLVTPATAVKHEGALATSHLHPQPDPNLNRRAGSRNTVAVRDLASWRRRRENRQRAGVRRVCTSPTIGMPLRPEHYRAAREALLASPVGFAVRRRAAREHIRGVSTPAAPSARSARRYAARFQSAARD